MRMPRQSHKTANHTQEPAEVAAAARAAAEAAAAAAEHVAAAGRVEQILPLDLKGCRRLKVTAV